MSSNFNPQFAKLGEILIHNGKATENGVISDLFISSNDQVENGALLMVLKSD